MPKLTPEERLERRRAQQRKYREAHREELREYNAKYNEEHKEERRKYVLAHREEKLKYARKYNLEHREEKRGHKLKRRFGLSQEDYDRMFAFQGGVCAICGSPPNGRALAVDHGHDSGSIRSLLCSSCNQGLGYFKDNPNLLRVAAEYIELYREGLDTCQQ